MNSDPDIDDVLTIDTTRTKRSTFGPVFRSKNEGPIVNSTSEFRAQSVVKADLRSHMQNERTVPGSPPDPSWWENVSDTTRSRMAEQCPREIAIGSPKSKR